MAEIIDRFSFMSWNVRGLNNIVRQEDVRQIVQQQKPMVVCLQETKMAQIDARIVGNTLGQDYTANFCYLPADGTHGGILLACRNSFIQINNAHLTTHTISVTVTDSRTSIQWTLTGVYGPQQEFDKRAFLTELRELKNIVKPAWLVVGDFNMIYQDQDKSNGRLNRRMMSRFRRALNHIEVKEIPLLHRKFTWTSSNDTLTMARIDRAF